MSLQNSSKLRVFLVFTLLVGFSCSPIWWVEYYLNQDGTAHLYNAYIFNELLANNDFYSQFLRINFEPIPNLTGHLFLSLLILIFPPMYASKILITLIFAGVVASCGWLHYCVRKFVGIETTLLIGTVIAFNWMWFLGFYNFIIALIGFNLTVGFWFARKDNLKLKDFALLSLLILFVYFSHLISFALLLFALTVLGIFHYKSVFDKRYLLTLGSFVFSIPFFLRYLWLGRANDRYFPKWTYISNIFSPKDWFLHLYSSDPFNLISRKSFPFVGFDSIFFVVFSPFFLIIVALGMLSFAAVKHRNGFETASRKGWVLLFLFSVLVWVFAPDDFGKSHGGIIRERVLLFGIIFLIPLLQTNVVSLLKKTAQVLLIFVIVFQTMVLFEFSEKSNKIAGQFRAVKEKLADGKTLGSVIFIKDGCQYRAAPLVTASTLLGIEKNVQVWSNYEIGYYLFPVITKTEADRKFAFDFMESSNFLLCYEKPEDRARKDKLNLVLQQYNDKFDYLLIWGDDSNNFIKSLSYFDENYIFETENIRLYKHR